MNKHLRITFTVLSAVFLAALLPASMIWQGLGFIICGVGALFFFVLMLFFKQSQEIQESKKQPKQPTFFSPDPELKEKRENDENSADKN